jgi:hypothetical protein
MVTPEVVGHIDPVCLVGRKDHGGHPSCGFVTGASRFLIGLVTRFATHDGLPAVAPAAWRR